MKISKWSLKITISGHFPLKRLCFWNLPLFLSYVILSPQLKIGSKLAKFGTQNPITQKLKGNSKIPTITFKNVYQRSFIPNFSLLALIVFPEKITTLFWDTGVLVKNGPKNGKMVIFWDFLYSKWLKLYIHLQQHQLQVSSKFEVFSMSSFHFVVLKLPYFGYF